MRGTAGKRSGTTPVFVIARSEATWQSQPTQTVRPPGNTVRSLRSVPIIIGTPVGMRVLGNALGVAFAEIATGLTALAMTHALIAIQEGPRAYPAPSGRTRPTL
jgi:hypothetical protein